MFVRVLAAAAFAATTASAALAQSGGLGSFDRSVVFGDSLSDNGNLFGTTGNPPPPYVDGRFSNGPVWVEQIFGPMNNPALGGSVNDDVNMAFGGARADDDANANGPVPSHQTQIGIFLASGGTLGANDLVISWAGANDLFQQIPTATTQAQLAAIGAETAGDQAFNVSTLIAAGAKNILVPNLPNIGAAPGFNGTAQGAGAGLVASSAYNDALAAQLGGIAAANADVNIIQMDIEAAFNAVLNNPAAFGFSNVTDQCLTTVSCVTGSTDEQNEFLFWDEVHPTTAGHALIAQYAALLFSTDVAAADQAGLGQAAADTQLAVTAQMFDRTTDWIDGSYARENGIHAEVIGVFSDLDARGNRAASSTNIYGVRAGFDQQMGDMLLGVSGAILAGDTRSGAVSADTLSFNLSAYGAAVAGPLYVSGVAGAGFTVFNDVERLIGFGNLKTEASTEAFNLGIAGEVGAILKLGNGFAVIPSARLGHVFSSVDGYEESGQLLAMSYGDRETNLTYWSGQVRATSTTSFGSVYGEIGYEDFVSTDGDAITAQLVGNTALPVTAIVDDPASRGLFLNVGANSRINDTISIDADYGVALNDGDGETHSAKLRVKIATNGIN
ncbi:MAG: autotransporter domain-containing protein [Pseudomonadota bacterium]